MMRQFGLGSNLLGSLRRPLTSGSGTRPGGADVELAPVNVEPLDGPGVEIDVVAEPCKERLLLFLLAMALIVPAATVVTVVAGEWVSSPSQRGWLILGFGFYIMAALRSLWSCFIQVYERVFHLKVELRRLVCPTLFGAVTNSISARVEECGETCSWDQEAVQEHDQLTVIFKYS